MSDAFPGEPPRLIARVRALSEQQRRCSPSVDELAGLCDALAATRVLLVIDRAAAIATRSEDRIRRVLGDRLVAEFDAFHPNPTSDQAAAAAHAALDSRANALVAFGGGSCMDVAKVGALGAGDSQHLVELCEGAGTSALDPLPVIAIPTTSGTGSEVTHFAAIYVRGRKVSVAHPSLRPRACVMDLGLHRAMPPRLAAAVGLDALCQAIESTWAVGSTQHSLEYAALARALISGALVDSVRAAGAPAREAMMWGAHGAGMAINISKTTAPHALSYQITTRTGTPHGIAAALTLGVIGAENARVEAANCRDPRGVDWVRERVDEAAATLGVSSRDMPGAVRSLLRALGVPATLREAGVERAALSAMAAEVDPVRLSNNPRLFTAEELARSLDAAWAGD